MRDLIGKAMPIHMTKYDGSYHRRWPVYYVACKGPLHIAQYRAGEQISRTRDPAADDASWPVRYGGDIYLYEDRWFNIARTRRDGRTWYYVNIATPAEFDGEAFHCIDLDLDVAWFTDEKPQVLDEDEFLDHSKAMQYPAEVIEHARSAVDEVLRLIQERAFPFDRA